MAVSELGDGEVAEVIVDGVAVALANVDGTFHAVSNVCPHAGGPLGDGEMDGSLLTCPYHGWGFDVQTGVCNVNDAVTVEQYDVKVIDGDVFVRLP